MPNMRHNTIKILLCLLSVEFTHKDLLWAFFSFSRTSLMNSVHRGVGQGCPTWYKGLWPDKFHLSSVSVSISLSSLLLLFALFCLLLCSCVIVSLCFQVKAGMGRCGGELGWGRVWLWRSSHPGMSSPGSERRRSIILYSCDMTTFWVWQQTVVFLVLYKEGCSVISKSICLKADIKIAIFCSGL